MVQSGRLHLLPPALRLMLNTKHLCAPTLKHINILAIKKLTSLLSSTYFGPVQWYQKLNRSDECLIEQHESFIKQTYRNRMVIPTTNGPLTLTIPTNHDTSMAMKDIRISDHANWRHVHWNALLSAYGESPFFEYYQDDIRPFYEKKYEFLFDFNMETMQKMIELLDIRPHISLTDHYVVSEERRVKNPTAVVADPTSLKDFRDAIRPKHPLPDPDFTPIRYYQVYEQKHGFLPNMSILDLLFNEGNEAIFFL